MKKKRTQHPSAGTCTDDFFNGKPHKLTWGGEAVKTPVELDIEFREYHQNFQLEYVIRYDAFNNINELHSLDDHTHMVYRNFLDDTQDGWNETVNVDEHGKEINRY